MNVEIYGNKSFIDRIPKKQTTKLNEAVGKELASLDNETINALAKAKKTLVVDVLDIKSNGLLVDGRLFDKSNMPISGKTCLMEITKMKDLTDPKVLAQHFSTLAKKLVDNAKMLR